MIIAREQGDSFKGWGQECSSVSQGHRYFMAFTFLHDTSDAQNRQSSIALCWWWEWEWANLNVPVPPLFLAHLRLALLASWDQNSGCDSGFFFFNSPEVKTFVQCLAASQPPVQHEALCRPRVDLQRPSSSRRQQRKPPQPLSSPPDCSLIPRCCSCQHHKLVFNNVTTFNQH